MWAVVLNVFLTCCISLCLSKNPKVHKMLSGLEKYHETYPLPSLPYKYDELEPWIDEYTLKEHHLGILADYTLQMNQNLKEWRASGNNSALAKSSILDIIKNVNGIPEKWQVPLLRSIGGYLNHIFYFATLSPNPKEQKKPLSDAMSYAISHSFGKFEKFVDKFNNSADQIFSNGYVWLVRVPNYRYLTIYVGIQESTPITVNYEPILGIDLWEHAYFSKYGNDREEYLRNWWKLVDFDKVEEVMNWWWSFDRKHDEL